MILKRHTIRAKESETTKYERDTSDTMATKQQQRKVRAAAELTSIEHGCFDTAALQQELAQALEDDRLYKLTDSMKKRAIHTATNYDDFKVRSRSVPRASRRYRSHLHVYHSSRTSSRAQISSQSRRKSSRASPRRRDRRRPT